ncbi:uncharacterized protein LOC129892997 [Solanum dulcamara]|uniref:uncharacterized protein LOC129892997 n=1 Tax=Solanum dulcamara TaxID=45834 RepID=UPI002485B4B6|nr:uncharacterized protein LOC129892997 [Solanum dulcamara]
MARTRITTRGRGREALPEVNVGTTTRGRDRGRTRGRGRGVAAGRGRARGAAPARGRAREASLEPQIDGREEQVPQESATAPLLQATLIRVLDALEGFNQSVRVNGTPEGSQTRARAQTPRQHQIPIVRDPVDQPPAGPRADEDGIQVGGAQVAPVLMLTDDEQRRYERFRKMDPPQFQGGKTEDAHD